MDYIKTDLKKDEGFRNHAYQDHLGFWTIGYGRLIDKRRDGGISENEADQMLDNDIEKVKRSLSRNIDFYDELPAQVKRALVNMGFQLGVDGLLGFRKMLKYLSRKQYAMAADEALDSMWAEQTPDRARRVTDWMRFAE